MATAPTPGVGARKEAQAEAQKIMTIVLRGQPYRIAAGNIPLIVQDYFEQQTRRTVEYALGDGRVVGSTLQLASMVYLARLLAGETQLRWKSFLEEFPTDLTEDDIEVTVDDPEGDDPEA